MTRGQQQKLLQEAREGSRAQRLQNPLLKELYLQLY